MKIYKLFTLVSLAISVVSCDKSYKYIEIVSENSETEVSIEKEKEEMIIKAKNDTTAYFKAFELFCISLKFKKDMIEAFGKYETTPLRFKLLNEKGVDISKNTVIPNRIEREREIKKQVFATKNNIKELVDQERNSGPKESKKEINLSSPEIVKLSRNFNIKEDEFSENKLIWYYPKSAPNYLNCNALYCYFQLENNLANNLRLRLQYFSDEWLFISKVIFLIDGKVFEFIPMETKTDSGNGGQIWEWIDQEITTNEIKIINAVANAKEAKMKLVGTKYFDIKPITKSQINAMKQTLELYHLMGGN